MSAAYLMPALRQHAVLTHIAMLLHHCKLNSSSVLPLFTPGISALQQQLNLPQW
jgi:hypothetical protein